MSDASFTKTGEHMPDMIEMANDPANCACHYFHSEEHCPAHGDHHAEQAVSDWGEDPQKWVIQKSAFGGGWVCHPPRDGEPSLHPSFLDAVAVIRKRVSKR